ncbi:MAG TPA: ferredoxin-NADPH reductase, partial [Acidimicrobiia bacterium]
MSGQFPWYVARSAGLVAWALLAASVLWGLALSTKILSPKVRPNWILDLHRWLGGLALVFTG